MFANASLDTVPSRTVGGRPVRFALADFVRHMVATRFVGMFVLSITATLVDAGPLLPPGQVGNLLEMTNANVRLEYDLSTGRADFYWQNSLKISGFYAG